jgi:hypothetical protein
MSVSLLQKVSTHAATVINPADYNIKYFRWSDADMNGNTPFIVYRKAGDGSSNILLQQVDVMIQLCQNPDSVVVGDAAMDLILRLFRGQTVQDGVIRFDPIGGVQGPMYLQNGRPIWELTIRCFTENL